MTNPTPPRGDRPEESGGASTLSGLAGRPVVEHVAVFEAEHARLQRQLATIDQL